MIVVTGATGFIGSYLIKKLNQENFNAIVAVDKFDDPVKNKNLDGLKLEQQVDLDDFMKWLDANHELLRGYAARSC